MLDDQDREGTDEGVKKKVETVHFSFAITGSEKTEIPQVREDIHLASRPKKTPVI